MGCRKLQIQDYFNLKNSHDKPDTYAYNDDYVTEPLSKVELQILFCIQKILSLLCNICKLHTINISSIEITYTYDDDHTLPRFKQTLIYSSFSTYREFNPRHIAHIEKSQNSKNTPYIFSSEDADTETGLVYYNYRYYSPELGRWLSRDPIEEDGGLNLYGMVGNQPTKYTDYLGMDFEWSDLYDWIPGLSSEKGNVTERVRECKIQISVGHGDFITSNIRNVFDLASGGYTTYFGVVPHSEGEDSYQFVTQARNDPSVAGAAVYTCHAFNYNVNLFVAGKSLSGGSAYYKWTPLRVQKDDADSVAKKHYDEVIDNIDSYCEEYSECCELSVSVKYRGLVDSVNTNKGESLHEKIMIGLKNFKNKCKQKKVWKTESRTYDCCEKKWKE